MNVKNAIFAGVIAVATALTPMSVSMAADFIAPPLPLDRPAAVQIVNNFDGPYFGIGGTTIWDSNEYTPTLSIGIDQRYDVVIVGGEAWGAVNVTGEDVPSLETIGFDAKVGFAVTENVAVYGLAGVEVNIDTAIARNAIGVGADVALTDDVYLTGSYKRVTDLGTFDNPSDRVSIGLKFPF